MTQASTEGTTGAEARALADEAIAQARAALAESKTGDVNVVRAGERLIISVPGEDGTMRTIQLSDDGSRMLAVDGISTREIAPRNRALPDGLVDMMGIICGMVAITTLGAPLVKAWARRFERRHEVRQNAQIEQRLATIEQAIETVAVEVERISEGQRFTTKLLADKAQPGMERVR